MRQSKANIYDYPFLVGITTEKSLISFYLNAQLKHLVFGRYGTISVRFYKLFVESDFVTLNFGAGT